MSIGNVIPFSLIIPHLHDHSPQDRVPMGDRRTPPTNSTEFSPGHIPTFLKNRCVLRSTPPVCVLKTSTGSADAGSGS